jgi:uncharacterized repeat protein (TIGR01451 family)
MGNLRSGAVTALLISLFVCGAAFGQAIDLRINSITDSPDQITLSQGNVTYSLSVTNNTASTTATNVILSATLPPSSAYVSSSATNSGSCSESGGVVTCSWATLPAFNTYSASIVVTPGAGGANVLSASLTGDQADPTPSNNSDSETTTVNATIDLQLNGISDSPTDITLGQGNVTYTINTYNASTSNATNAALTINLPASSTYVSSSSASYACSQTSASVVLCTLASYGAFTSLSASVTVTPGVGGTNTLSASIAATQGDHVPANNSESETTTVNATIDLQLNGISDSPADITLGQGDVTYTINTYNSSTSKATGAVLTINLPASSTFVSASSASYACSQTSASVVTCTLATYNAFNSLSATVTVTPGTGGTNTLSASITAAQGDPVPANNSESESTTVNATIDLQMNGIGDSPADITLGQGNVTYSLNTYNASTSKATNTVLTINLPASSTFVSATANLGGTCGESTPGVVTCNWAVHNAFNSPTITVVITPGAGGTNTLTASYASTDQSDHVPANNSESETTTVNATIDLQMSGIGDNPNDITLGQGNVTYSLNTYNASTSKATNTVLTINLPASSTFVSASANLGGTCSESTPGVVTCNWAVHNAFNSPTITVVVTPGAGGTNTLTASYASTDQSDHVPANNSESETTTVNATIDLQMSGISDSPNDITLGQGNVTYSINTYNASTSKATNTVLTINLPASSSFVSATANLSGTCSESTPGVVTCNWATHNAFNSPTVTLVVTPGTGGTNTLTASYASTDQSDHVPGNNSESETTTVNATIDLQMSGISDSPNDITLGQGNVTYSINTYNASTSKATNTVLTINLPASSSYVSATANLSGTCSLSSPGVVTCSWATHNAFNSPTVTLVVTPGAGGTNTLTASYASSDQSDHVPANNSESETTTVNATIDLQMSGIGDNPNDITLGQGNVTYTINTYNASTSKATNTVLTLNLPASSTYVSATANLSGTCSLSSPGVVTCNWATHNAFNSPTVTLVVTPGAGGTNTLSASYASSDQSDHVPSNNSENETTTVNATIDLQLTVGDTPDPRTLAAGNVTYNVSLNNLSTSKATNPTITVNLDPSTNFVSVTPSSGGTCPTTGPTVVCTWTDIAAFSNRSFSLVVTPTAAQQISATAAVTADQGDHVPSNNSETETTNINPGSAPAIGGFTPTSGPVNTVVTITGSNFFSSTAVKFNGVNSTFTVNNNGSITATVPAGATTGSIAITNSVGTTTSGSQFTVTPAPDLTISKTASAATTPTSSSFDYFIVVTNSGAGPANDVTVTDTLPASVTLNSISASGWSCSGNPTITCTRGALAASGSTTTITINVTAPASGTTVSNTATVSTTTPESSTANNASSVSVGVVGCPSTPVITAPATVCAGTSGHTASIAPVPGATYTWAIVSGNGTITAGAGTDTITFTAGTADPLTLQVSVDVTSCPTATNTINVNVSTPTATITPSGPTTFCAGGSVTLTANAGSSYLWSNGATTQSIVVTTGGSYSVTVTNAAGCSATSAATTVGILVLPTATITPSGPTTFCQGGSVTLTADPGDSWLWSNGATSQSILVTTPGNYSVTVTDGGCSTTSAEETVTVNPIPDATVNASGPTAFCAGGSVTLTAPAGMANYNWSNGGTGQSITVNAAGTFSVTVTDANGCVNTSSPVIVTVEPAPTATIAASGATTFCAGGSVTLSANGGMAGYLWSNGATTPSINVTTGGSYTVTVTDASGCTATSAPMVVTVNPAPPATITASGPTTFCTGGSVTLNAPAGMTSYSWSNGATSQSITVNAGGTFTVTVIDGSGCSATSAPTTVTVTTPPTATITPGGPTTFCAGGSVTLNAPAGMSNYSWSNGATTPSINVTAAGSYFVTVTDSAGCTATSSPVSVTVTAATPATITASGPTTFCSGGSVTLTASNGSAYLWSTGATTQSITVGASGNYSVTVTDGNGCNAISAPATVTVNPLPPVVITGPAQTCPGTTITLDAGANFSSYSWSTGATTQQITVAPAADTTYSVTVTDANGCPATASHLVTLNATPAATIAAPTAVCTASNNNAASVPTQPGASYVWTISGGAFAGAADGPAVTFSVTSTTSVTLGVTVTNGTCTSTGNVVIPVNPLPVPVITAPSSVNASSSGNTASVVPEAGASYFWTITNGTIAAGGATPNVTFSAGPAGPITLSVTATLNGCSATTSTVISVASTTPNNADLVITKSAPSTVPAGAQFTYTITAANRGPATSQNASIVDTLPAGVALLGVNDGPWTCQTAGNQLNCISDVLPNASSTITLTVVAPSQAGTITNTATINANVTPDPNPANNSDSATTTVLVQSPVCPAAPPSLVAPADGATVDSPVTLSWTGVANATSYDVWIVTSGVPLLAGSTATTSLTRGVEPGPSSWFVVAHVAGCEVLTSAQRAFTVRPADSCGTNGRPTITSPTGGTHGTSVVFSWTAVASAIGYRVWIEVNGEAAQDVGTTSGATSLTVNVPPGAIVAYVDALFSGCPPTRSDAVAFTVPAPDPCAGRTAVVLTAPANNATINASSVELSWNAASNADGYRVFASVDGAAPAVVGETDETSLRVHFERGEVIWFVHALYDGCAATESPRFRFTIPARDNCAVARPELVAPANGATVTSGEVTFDWNAVAEAIGYEVWLGLDNGTPTLIGATPANVTSLTRNVPPGELRWFVRVLVDRCPNRDSQFGRFEFTPPAACEANRRPLAVSPQDDATIAGPVDFDWNDVGATRYELYAARGNAEPVKIADATASRADDVTLAAGNYRWFVRAFFAQGCAPLDMVSQTLEVVPLPAACAPLAMPIVSAPGQISSGVEFLIQWTPVAGATSYQLQLASDDDFDDAGTITTTATQHALTANAFGSPVTRYARVRAIDGRCTPLPSIGAFGPASAIFVLPANQSDGSAPLGNANLVTYSLPLGAELAGQTFTAAPTQPWLSVAPAAGVVPAGGVNLTVTANTAGLPPGTSLGGVTVTLSTPGARIGVNGSTTVTSPFTINLVTPVAPTPKNTPPPDALIIPAVANADGIGSHFQSDVRVSNTSAQVMKYQLSYIPTGEAGIAAGRQTTFSIEPGRTVALDDILETWFGTGSTNAIGTLEVRPLTEVAKSTSSAAMGALANIVTFASSRTFNVTPNGTFGQYIPAIPFANFIDKTSVLSLQQIAQSAKYRTNLGIVEGSGEPVSLLVKVFGANGALLTDFPVNLKGGQHTQLNGFLAQHQINSLDDGRVEVQVTSGNGKVTAYASVIDNETADPLLVAPVTLGQAGNTKWVVPGVADLSNGAANWQTDVRIFNAGAAPADLTLSFHSQNGGEPKTATLTLQPGEVRQLDRALSMFGVTQDGGAMHIATTEATRLVATARTYNQTTQGTYGQFIAAVTPAEAAGIGTRPLQLLQLEESSRYRSNVGFAEVSGKPVTLEVSIVPPDAKFTATVRVELAANEFRQLNSMLAGLGIGEIYNARVSVRAIEGEGRATAYASVIDLKTNDPTLVPAQ